jgi:hypothetical protein
VSTIDANRKKRFGVALGAVVMANSAVLLSMASGRLFKHGSELIFGLEARSWGFAVLGLAIVGTGAGIAALVTSARKLRD